MREEPLSGVNAGGITRRTLIERGVGLGAAAMLPGVLAACGDSSGGAASAGGAPTTGGKPKRGGRLRVATPGSGNKEVVHPFQGTTPADVNRRLQLFDPLFSSSSQDSGFKPYLAEKVEPNGDGTVWTITLRSGVMTHRGRALTSDDAIWSMQVVNDVKGGNYGSPFASHMDLKKGFKKVDDLTFQMKLNKPIGDLGSIARDTSSIIAPKDWDADPKQPVGTGPFEFVSFTAGQRSLFKRNANYWVGDGKPYIDELEIVSIPDATARANALKRGEADAVENFDFLQAKTLKNDPSVVLLNAPSEWTIPFITRYDKDPFKQLQARQAMKYAIDREALVDTVFFGFGTVGNDQFGKNGPATYYNADLEQRAYDPERAKSLLADAGYPDGVDVELNLAPSCGCQGPEGTVGTAAQAFQQQAKGAGVNFKIKTTTNLDQWNLLSFPFTATWWSPGVPFVYNWFLSDSTYNEGWKDPAWDRLYYNALGELDPAKQKEYWGELQATFYEKSGHVIWGHYNLIDGLSPKVRGAYPNQWSLSTYDFKSYWLA
jgi:peptide/nickel transport system substrate-binding protein